MRALKILVVDDESDIRSLLKEILSEEGFEVSVAADANEARQHMGQNEVDLVLLDIWMPDTDGITLLREWSNEGLACPVVMMSGHGTVDTAVEATRLGAFDFIEKPLSLAKLLRVVERALDSGRGKRKEFAARLLPSFIEPIGKSLTMQKLREQVRKVAPHDAAVLMSGEAGTGREAFARYLHSLSTVAQGPFIDVIASSITDENAEKQLLGEESGEEITQGLLEQAKGGIFYINELGDLSNKAQTVLLAAIEKRSFLRVNGKERVTVDCRLVSSAQPGFENDGRFRRDLLGHMNVVTLRIPPLREYSEDVPDLLNYYVDVLVDNEGVPFRRFSVAAQNRLRNFPWPGNIRNLRNIVHRLLILGGDEEISLKEVEDALAVEEPSGGDSLVKQDLLGLPLREAREQFERAYLEQQLTLCGGKVGRLAERVGMERTHLYRKLRSLSIEFGQGSGDD